MDPVGDQPGPHPSASSAAPTSPGSRLPSWLMALKRCVTSARPPRTPPPPPPAGVAVPEADHRPRRGQRRDLRRRRRWPAPASPSAPAAAAPRRQAARGPRPASAGSARGSCAPLRRRIEMRPLEVQPEEARHPRRRRRDARLDRRARDLGRVGDQRRQAARSSRAARAPRRSSRMPASAGWSFSITPPPPLTCRSTNPGASTPPSSRDQLARRRLGRGHDRRATRPSSTTSAAPACSRAAVEDRGAGEDRGAHTVSVTLRRCGGVSGSNPRRRASASMKR